MKVALVHDQIAEYGGAERVLEALCEIYPDAPIYTAFYRKDGTAWKHFKHRKIIPSWAHYIPFFASKLHSPLRFLAPWIWGSFDFSRYDVVITSASWYVTKGVINRKKTENGKQKTDSGETEDRSKEIFVPSGKSAVRSQSSVVRPLEICYCHTPPRWLYGYKTSVELQRFWPVKVYASIVGHFMRMYDFNAAQRVNYFIANSEEIRGRINKFYRREATVIYPPVGLGSRVQGLGVSNKKRDYYFIVSRIVGAKGLDLAIEAAKKLKIKLKIAGSPAGYYMEHKKLKLSADDNVEFLGHVTDEELVKLYSGAKAFLALATDEDFGITPAEAMSCGTPVIAYYGGGYKETVIDGKTGFFFHQQTVEDLCDVIRKFETLRQTQYNNMSENCKKHAEKFSSVRFKKEIKQFVNKHAKE